MQRTSPLRTCSDYGREYIALLSGAGAKTRLRHVSLQVLTAAVSCACSQGNGRRTLEWPAHGLVCTATFDTTGGNKQDPCKQCPFTLGLVLLRLRLAMQYSAQRHLMPGGYGAELHHPSIFYCLFTTFVGVIGLSSVFHLILYVSRQLLRFNLHYSGCIQDIVLKQKRIATRDLQSAAFVQIMRNLDTHNTMGSGDSVRIQAAFSPPALCRATCVLFPDRFSGMPRFHVCRCNDLQ